MHFYANGYENSRNGVFVLEVVFRSDTLQLYSRINDYETNFKHDLLVEAMHKNFHSLRLELSVCVDISSTLRVYISHGESWEGLEKTA